MLSATDIANARLAKHEIPTLLYFCGCTPCAVRVFHTGQRQHGGAVIPEGECTGKRYIRQAVVAGKDRPHIFIIAYIGGVKAAQIQARQTAAH